MRVTAWAAPRGYENGQLGRGPVLHVAGQIGWDAAGRIVDGGLVAQFAQALDNVLAVVGAAGGVARDVASMTVFVTDLEAYRAGRRALGPIWRERLGEHFPAMALVGVAGLLEPGAMVEIQAVAHLPEGAP